MSDQDYSATMNESLASTIRMLRRIANLLENTPEAAEAIDAFAFAALFHPDKVPKSFKDDVSFNKPCWGARRRNICVPLADVMLDLASGMLREEENSWKPVEEKPEDGVIH